VPLPPPVNGWYADAGPSLSADGLSLYFASDRPGGYGDFDIWVSTRKSKTAPWGQPANLGPTVNSPYYDNHPCISADGLSLYFDSYRPGGQGYDVWVTTRKTTQHAWGTPVNLGPVVNTSGIELSPSISSSGLVLFFDSRVVDRDIWMAARSTPDDPWSPAVNPGAPVNTLYFDTDPCPAVNESILYFASDRSGGVGGQDLWEVPVIPSADFNGDGVVNLKDFALLARSWQQCQRLVDIGPTAFGDGIVDDQDLAVFAENWLADNRLIGHWAFDEAAGGQAKDSIGGHDATIHGSPMWRPQGGRVGGAIELDGLDDYLTTDLIVNPGTSPFSIFVWVKGGAAGQVVLSQLSGANWLRADAQGCLLTELQAAGRPGWTLTSSALITDGVWHRLGLTWDGSNRILYVDGMEVAKDTQPSLTGATYGLNIGTGSAFASGTFWSGLLDDLYFYNRAMKP
jgi:hypothetical protein